MIGSIAARHSKMTLTVASAVIESSWYVRDKEIHQSPTDSANVTSRLTKFSKAKVDPPSVGLLNLGSVKGA